MPVQRTMKVGGIYSPHIKGDYYLYVLIKEQHYIFIYNEFRHVYYNTLYNHENIISEIFVDEL